MMKETRSRKAASELCARFAADCFRLCLLDIGSWEDAEAALQNSMISFRKSSAAEQNIVAARQALAAATLPACRAFHIHGRQDAAGVLRAMERHAHGDAAQTALLQALFARPRWERVSLGLAAVLDFMPAEIAPFVKRSSVEVQALLDGQDRSALNAALGTLLPDTTQEALEEALWVGAKVTPEFRIRNLSLVFASVMLLSAAALVLLYRLLIANQPVPDFFGPDTAQSFAQDESFTTLYRELLNELSGYTYEMTYCYSGEKDAPVEWLPLYDGAEPEVLEDGVRGGYTIATLYGAGAELSGQTKDTTVCRYTKAVYGLLPDDAPVYTNQEYLVWYDGQADGLNLSQDRIYQIVATRTKLTQTELDGLPAFTPDVAATQKKYKGCDVRPMYVKYCSQDTKAWQIVPALQISGAQAKLPKDVTAQWFAPKELTFLTTGAALNAKDYLFSATAERLGMFFCGADGVDDALLRDVFTDDTGALPYWEEACARVRTRQVPDVRGKTIAEATALLTQSGLAAVAGDGETDLSRTVLRTDPATDEVVAYASQVTLYTTEEP